MTGTAPWEQAGTLTIERDRLEVWLSAMDAVIDELHDDLVRRSIVHLTTLREDMQAHLEAAR